MALTKEEKLMFVAVADEILMNSFGVSEHMTEEEREDVADRLREVFDGKAPKELRLALINTARKFYDEIQAGDYE